MISKGGSSCSDTIHSTAAKLGILLQLLHFELVLVFPIQVYHFVRQASLVHCFLEIGQGRQEDIIIADITCQLKWSAKEVEHLTHNG